MFSDQSTQPLTEKPGAPIERTVEYSRNLGLPLAIIQLKLRLENGFGENQRQIRSTQVAEVRKLYESNDEDAKWYDLAEQEELLEKVKTWEQRAQRTVDFLEQLKEGQYPTDWQEKPEGFLDDYPYEGIFRHNVVRANFSAETAYRKSGVDQTSATKEDVSRILTDFVIAHDQFLLKKAKKGEIYGAGAYDISKNPFIEET